MCVLITPSLPTHPAAAAAAAAAAAMAVASWTPAASTAANAMLRVSFAEYEAAMDKPVIRATAKQHWGEDIPDGQPMAPWLFKCRQCVGHAMKDFVVEERDWDAFTIGAIYKSHLPIFLPAAIRDNDAAREMHR